VQEPLAQKKLPFTSAWHLRDEQKCFFNIVHGVPSGQPGGAHFVAASSRETTLVERVLPED
jgi:hypothetical protein